MKKIKIYFTKAKKPGFSRVSSSSKKFFLDRLSSGDVDSKAGCIMEYYDNRVNYTVLTHLGRNDKTNDELQELGAKSIKKAMSFQSKENREVTLAFDKTIGNKERYYIEKGILMGKMKDDFYKTKDDEEKGKSKKGKKNADKSQMVIRGIYNEDLEDIVAAIDMARELISKPSNVIDPESLEKYIKDNLEKGKGLKVSYFGQKQIEKENMNLFVAVNKGSTFDAKMITMDYNPKGYKGDPIVLVGKGLTYDSGGYYFKSYPHMNDMHGDMAGAGTVISVMSVLKDLGIKKRVIGLIGITENMIDANSYKNGDIYTARNGRTVEIGHTDAEGRLVLADLLSYADDKFSPSLVIDIATLTGACAPAIGEMYSGVFSDNQKLLDKMKLIGDKVNDRVWHLPFDKDVKDAVKGTMADVSNVSSLSGMMGTATAAAFLANFVKDTKKWIHLDIAGSGLRKKMKKAYDLPNGIGSGASVHLIIEYLRG